jgi:signal transduction histidine kinase
VTRPSLTIRARLTLLYTALFAACGAAVVAITYTLVGASLRGTSADKQAQVSAPSEFLAACKQATQNGTIDPNLKAKCDAAFRQGVKIGVQTQRDLTLDHLLTYSLITLAAVTVLAAIAGWLVAGRVLRPVHRITAAARAASEHNLSGRVALTGPRDELRELADTFDDMLTRLDAAFDSQRRFIANASHELRTPLTVMRTTIDVVLAKPAPTPAELTAMAEDVRAAADHAEALIEALLTLARNERGLTVHEPVDLATVAEDVLDTADLDGLLLRTSLTPAATTGDPVLLERLAANLVDNAVRYNVPGGEVTVLTSTVDGAVGRYAQLVVANTGPVIEPATVAGLFEPFRRLQDRTASDGVGLGLAIVASIATVHAGIVTANALPGGGLEVTVTVPHVAVPPTATPAAELTATRGTLW